MAGPMLNKILGLAIVHVVETKDQKADELKKGGIHPRGGRGAGK
jgi:hypothetical protein